MSYFFRCLSIEALKTKRTVYLAGVVLLPLALGFLNFLLLTGAAMNYNYAQPGGWVHFEHNTITFWSLLVFPAVLILLTAFIAHQEHDAKHWRQLMCLALPKTALVLAKEVMVIGLALLSCLTLWVGNIVWGWLFSLLRPELGLSIQRIALADMLAPYLWILAFSMVILAFHFWLSMHVQNFVLSIGCGFALSLAGAFTHKIAIWKMIFPWALPSLVYTATSWPEVYTGLLYSGVGFLLITAAGCWSFLRRDVVN